MMMIYQLLEGKFDVKIDCLLVILLYRLMWSGFESNYFRVIRGRCAIQSSVTSFSVLQRNARAFSTYNFLENRNKPQQLEIV